MGTSCVSHKYDFSFGVAQSVSPKIFVTSSNIFFLNTPFAHPSEDKSHKQGSLRNDKNKTLCIQLFGWHHVCTLRNCFVYCQVWHWPKGVGPRCGRKQWQSRHYGALSSRKHRLVGAGSTKNWDSCCNDHQLVHVVPLDSIWKLVGVVLVHGYP